MTIYFNSVQGIAGYLGVLNITALDWMFKDEKIKVEKGSFSRDVVRQSELDRVAKEIAARKLKEGDVAPKDATELLERYTEYMIAAKKYRDYEFEYAATSLLTAYNIDVINLNLRGLGISDGEVWEASDGNTYSVSVSDGLCGEMLLQDSSWASVCPYRLLSSLDHEDLKKTKSLGSYWANFIDNDW